MTMTPQEKAVVQAAIAWRQRGVSARAHAALSLEEAAWLLITSCEKCNTARHECPGCGASLGHGDTACTDCDSRETLHSMCDTYCGPDCTTSPADRAFFTEQVRGYAQAVMQEWMRIADLADNRDQAFQVRVRWQNDDGECVIGESNPGGYGEEYGRFRITAHVEDLGPIPPIGPENDLGVYGIGDERAGEPVSAGQEEKLERWGRDMAAAEPEPEPELIWVRRTLVDVRDGDTIRMPGQEGSERTVETISPPIDWHMHPAGRSPANWTAMRVQLIAPSTNCGCIADPESTGACGHVERTTLDKLPPAMAVEIQLTETEAMVIESLGWDNRIRTIPTTATTETEK